MALFTSYSCRMVCRSKGKSAVGKAAYIGGRKLIHNKANKTFNYQHKASEVVYSKIIAPDSYPTWVYNPHELWNFVEQAEKRKDAQLARELIVALPKQLSGEKREHLITAYCYKHFVEKGMVADINIHNVDKNPHAHVLLTTRKILKDGNFGEKERAWNKRHILKEWRLDWEVMVNKYLEESNINIKIASGSYKALKIRKVPTLHVGNNSWKKYRLQINQYIKRINSLLNKDKTSFFSAINFSKEIEKTIYNIKSYIEENNIKPHKKMNNSIKMLHEIKANYHRLINNRENNMPTSDSKIFDGRV